MLRNGTAIRNALAIFIGSPWPRKRPHGLFGLIFSWIERDRQRRQLAELDQHLLDDIGLSAADARRESHRPFWD
ncbi:MAG: DUF1127 domain-containing protein [Rhodospirillaceae bacterium]|nr:DUF1127 domain-containing protein [Rhodospirillaceae bacterium]